MNSNNSNSLTGQDLGLPPKAVCQADRGRVFVVCILLVGAVFLVYCRTLGYGFINFDDLGYFASNPHVQEGFTGRGLKWVFQAGYAGNWHPLTWLSLMLDAQLFGAGPAGPHFTNVLLHAINAALLFLLLRRLTGALWAAAAVAGLFAVHPLRVESVAWVAERKDVLSGLFFMLTLLMYSRYAQKRSRAQEACNADLRESGALDLRRSTLDYFLALLFFALGLMSKPMLVTMPFLLLLLDYWPLGRIQAFAGQPIFDLKPEGRGATFSPPDPGRSTVWQLILEKLPFIALSACACVATLVAQQEAIRSFVVLPLGPRVANALIAAVTYLVQMIWPANLALLYPYRLDSPVWLSIGAGVLLLGATCLVLMKGRQMPWLPVGWFWYLGMLVPVLGLVQVGAQSHADRYTYLTQIGLYLGMVWAVRALARSWHWRPWKLGATASGLGALLIVASWKQVSHWRNSRSLWQHTLACTSQNFTAHTYLGAALAAEGQTAEAIAHFRKALEIYPDCAEAANFMGDALFEEGRMEESAACYRRAIEIHPGFSEARNNIGILLAKDGRASEALDQFQKAVDLNPDFPEAQNNLGSALAEQGRTAEAVEHFQKALEIMPDHAKAHFNLANLLAAAGRSNEALEHYRRAAILMPGSSHVHYQFGVALQSQGKFAQAIAEFEKVLELDPAHPLARNCLAWLLATCPDASLRNGGRAVELARQPEPLWAGQSPEILDTLAAAYAETGDFEKAVEAAQRALSVASDQKNKPLADALEMRLKLYQVHCAYHEKP